MDVTNKYILLGIVCNNTRKVPFTRMTKVRKISIFEFRFPRWEQSLKARSHCPVCDRDLSLLLVRCVEDGGAVAIAQCEHLHGIPYNPSVTTRKIAVAIAQCERTWAFYLVSLFEYRSRLCTCPCTSHLLLSARTKTTSSQHVKHLMNKQSHVNSRAANGNRTEPVQRANVMKPLALSFFQGSPFKVQNRISSDKSMWRTWDFTSKFTRLRC